MNSIEVLKELCTGKDWVYDIDYSEENRLTVYVEYMNADIMTFVPEKVNNENVFLCFANYKRLCEQFEQNYIETVKDLVLQFGKQSVNDAFYEIHDADNAITDYYNKNPQLFDKLQVLYDKLGFDVLFDLLPKLD